MENFILAFIPLFVALDPPGMAGMFLGITHDLTQAEKNKIALQATATALVVATIFMFLGKFIFKAIGVTIGDFQIAGGLILLIVATRSLLEHEKEAITLNDDFGVVPLGMPLIAGPAVLSALIVLMDTVGMWATLAALIVNLLLLLLSITQVDKLKYLVGTLGLRAISKIIALLLVAIAVNMIRVGIQSVFSIPH